MTTAMQEIFHNLNKKKLGSNHLFNSSQIQESISVQLHEISSVTALWSRREKSVLFLRQLFKAKLRNHSNTIHPTPPHSTIKHPTPLHYKTPHSTPLQNTPPHSC